MFNDKHVFSDGQFYPITLAIQVLSIKANTCHDCSHNFVLILPKLSEKNYYTYKNS
jgi:hypothetical protein